MANDEKIYLNVFIYVIGISDYVDIWNWGFEGVRVYGRNWSYYDSFFIYFCRVKFDLFDVEEC